MLAQDGDRGFCFVRENLGGQMVLSTYGRSTGFCIDPIEKKPLNHFYPGTSVLSFGTAGCNLGCKFCQNWSISKSREVERLSEDATPEPIAAGPSRGCRSVAFTYNDPVIWAEYAIDTAKACRERGVKTVAVTAGYITPAARGPFYEDMDAANVDLKGFTEEFYQQLTLSHLQPVLDTLRWLKHETDVWFEITNLIIPQANDAPASWGRCATGCWRRRRRGAGALHGLPSRLPPEGPPATPPETLLAARDRPGCRAEVRLHGQHGGPRGRARTAPAAARWSSGGTGTTSGRTGWTGIAAAGAAIGSPGGSTRRRDTGGAGGCRSVSGSGPRDWGCFASDGLKMVRRGGSKHRPHRW